MYIERITHGITKTHVSYWFNKPDDILNPPFTETITFSLSDEFHSKIIKWLIFWRNPGQQFRNVIIATNTNDSFLFAGYSLTRMQDSDMFILIAKYVLTTTVVIIWCYFHAGRRWVCRRHKRQQCFHHHPTSFPVRSRNSDTESEGNSLMLNECNENVMKTNRLLVEFNDDRLPFLPELSVKSPNKYSSIMIYLHKPT